MIVIGAIWQADQRKDKRATWNYEGGVNTGTTSFDVDDSQYISGFGFDSESHPALETRKGRTSYGTSGGAVTRLLCNFGTTHLLRAVGTSLEYNSSGTTWTSISGTFDNSDYDFTNFDISGPALIITNGVDTPRYWDGSTLSTLTGSPPKGKYIASDNRRVYMANDDDDDSGDIVHYSSFQDATDWSTAENSGAVQFYTSNGGAITALKSFEGRIWAFKKDAFCLIFHTGDARVTHRLVEGSNDIGCVSFKTMQEVGSRLFWLGQNDVYMGAGGGASSIGQPIRRYLDDINEDHIDKCFSGTDGLRYYLGLVTGANTEPNILLVYDPRKDKNRRWDVQSEISEFRYAAMINNEWFAGDTDGQTYQMNTGDDDDGTEIPYEVVTKDFDEGEPESPKEYYQLHLQIKAPTGTTMTVEASVDQGGTYDTIGDPITTQASAQNVDVIVPLDTVRLAQWIRFRISGEGQFTLYRLQRYFRVLPPQI